MSKADDGGRLSRWAKRKAEARTPKRGRASPVAVQEIEEDVAVETLEKASTAADAPLVAVEPETEAVEEDGLTEEQREAIIAELPDIETLDKDSDFTQFMKEGVPQELMKAALRRLWLSDPIFANLDGMNEYDHNYRTMDKLITLADTNYKVGKGFMTDEDEEPEKDAVAEAEGDENGPEEDAEITEGEGESDTDEQPDSVAETIEDEDENDDDLELG